MASRKEYEMMFALNASLNGNFKGTFSKAQQEFAQLGKEIQEVNRLQKDISSYQKQQAAVQSTDAKLQNLQRQYDLLQREIEETEGPTAGLEREQARLEQRIKDTETALERQNNRLGSTKTRLEEAGVDTANLAGESARLASELEELRQQQEDAANAARSIGQAYQEAGESAESFGTQVSESFSAAQQVLISAGIAEGLQEIRDAYAECVSIAADFEEGMSNVEALSGSTAQEMAELTAKAKELGAETKYTALESSEAMGYMAMAGWDAQQMMAGMSGVIDLARASGEDLAMVSDIVTDNLTAFGLTAADTAHFADVLAAAATSSNTSVGIMGETFKQSASIAGALGYSIEDVAVAVGLMANAGIKGSIGGTALKNTFNGLLEGVTLTGAAFGEYEYSAVKADGAMKDFAGTIDELRFYFDQMTEAERVNNAMALAGQEGYGGLLAILNAADEDYASLTRSINDCSGAARRMAEIKMDNLNGQLALMDSAWDALKTTIGEEFNPELRELAETGTDVLTWANSFVQANPVLVKGVMTFTGVMGGAAVAVTGVNAALSVFKALNVAALFTGPVGAILGAAAAVAGAAAAVVSFTTAMDDGIPSVKELTEAAREMDASLEAAAGTYDDTAGSVLAAANVADTYIGKLEEMGSHASLSAAEQQEYHNILTLLCQTVPDLADSINLETNTIEGGTAALRANTEAWKQNAMAQAYQDRLTAIYAAQADVLIEAEKNSIELTRAQAALEAAEKKRADTLSRMNGILAQIDAADDPEKVRALQYEYDQLEMSLGDVESEIWQAKRAEETYTLAVKDGEEAAAAAQEEIRLKEEAVKSLLESMGLYTDGQEDMTAAETEFQGVMEGVTGQIASLTQVYYEAYDAAVESFSGQFGLFDEAKASADATVEAAQRALDTQLSYWQGYAGNIAELKEISAEDLGVTQENYNALMEYVRNGTPEAAGLAASMVKEINKGNTQALTDLANTLGEIGESQTEAAGNVAEWASGLNEQMDQLKTDFEDVVRDMDRSDLAEESARSTIQAFIDEAENMLPVVRDAYAMLGEAAANALGLELTPARSTSGLKSNDSNFNAYASGTSNAPPGWAWVGEEGPELIHMHGGETVLPAEVSREFAVLTAYGNEAAAYAAASDNAVPAMEAVPAYSGASLTAEVHIHLEGNAPPETVQALEDYVRRGEIQEAVADAMANIQLDALRGAYV